MNLGWRPDEIAYVLDHSEARGIVVEAQLRAASWLPAVEKVPAVRDVDRRARAPARTTPRTLPDRTWHTFDGVAAADDAEPEVLVDDRDADQLPVHERHDRRSRRASSAATPPIYLESLMVAAETRLDADDRFACLMPMFHTAQLNGFCTPAVMVGATQYLLRGFDADALLAADRARAHHADLRAADDVPGAGRPPGRRRARPVVAAAAAYAMAPMPDAQLRRCLDRFGCDFYLRSGRPR